MSDTEAEIAAFKEIAENARKLAMAAVGLALGAAGVAILCLGGHHA